MTRVSCPGCRLRFGRATAAHLIACPACGGPLETILAAQGVGLALFTPSVPPVQPLFDAVAARCPVPPIDGRPR